MKYSSYIKNLTLNINNKNVLCLPYGRIYKCDSYALLSYGTYLFLPSAHDLKIQGGYLYQESFELALTNTWEDQAKSLSLYWRSFLKDFFQLLQNMEKYPISFDIQWAINGVVLLPHQRKCYKPLVSLKTHYHFFDILFIKRLDVWGKRNKDLVEQLDKNYLSNFQNSYISMKGENVLPLNVLSLWMKAEFPVLMLHAWHDIIQRYIYFPEDPFNLERILFLSDISSKYDYILLYPSEDSPEDSPLIDNIFGTELKLQLYGFSLERYASWHFYHQVYVIIEELRRKRQGYMGLYSSVNRLNYFSELRCLNRLRKMFSF